MSEKANNAGGGGIGLMGALFLVLLTLKLLGKISVSWWVVTVPLWGGVVLVFVIAFVALTIAAIAQARKQ